MTPGKPGNRLMNRNVVPLTVGWCACAAFGIAGSHGSITLMGPVVMLLFLLKATGVAPAEARAPESRGDACRACQRTTHRFFPGPPRPDPHGSTRQ